MQKLVLDPSLSFDQKLQAWYNHLDTFINQEEKDKTPKDYAAWAADVNESILAPIDALFREKFNNDMPLKIQPLDAKPKVKKDDHLKRLKANRYNIFSYQRKTFIEQAGDL